MMEVIQILRKFNACEDAQEWVKSQPSQEIAELWNSCPRGDWLLWLAGRAGIERTRLVFAACQCARLALHYVKPGEERPLQAIEIAEAWTRGEATIGEARDAADAANAATYTADAAANAAAYAADAASAAAYAAYAANAAYAAAFAADAANAAANAASAADASRKEMHRKCADMVRRHISLNEVLTALEAGGKQ